MRPPSPGSSRRCPSITAGRNVVHVDRAPLPQCPIGDAPSLLNTSYNFKAEIEVPAGGAEGMLITQGGRFAGYGFPTQGQAGVQLEPRRAEVGEVGGAPEALAPASTRSNSTSSTTGWHGHARVQQHERHRARR